MKKLLFLSLLLLTAFTTQAAAPKISFSWDNNTKEITGTDSFTSADGYFTITTLGSTSPSNRNKEGYVSAIKCRAIEIDMTTFNSGAGFSIGRVAFALQNGSSGNDMTATVSYYNGSAWVQTESLTVAGNASTTYSPATIVSKGNVQKIKFDLSNSSWFYGVQVYESTVADGAPAFVSAEPAENSYLPASGTIFLTFDELVKEGTGNITLGSATISNVAYKGNSVEIAYTGFTANASLSVDAGKITDLSGNPLAGALNIAYLRDVTAPTFVSISPAQTELIHINDLGENARKIKITFNEDIKIDETKTITFGNGTTNATVTPGVSGSVLTLSYAGLAYDVVNTLVIPAGLVLDLSNNAWAGDTYAYTTASRDNTAPVLERQSDANGASGLPVSGSLWFAFDEIVVAANQSATINNAPVTLSNNGKVIGVNYTALAYNGQNSLLIPAGCITDTVGNAYGEIALSFSTEAKTAKLFDMIVAADGSGDYIKIQDAIDAIADDTRRTLIYIKQGTYSEKLCVWKNNVSLIGENADKVIITWNECASTSTLQNSKYPTGINNTGTDASYTMLIVGNNFYGENFSVRNDYDYAAGTEANKQAVALEHIKGDRHVLKNVKMYSFQDTYYPKTANTRQYLYNCQILGGTDFIFGGGTTFIDNATIYCYEGGQYITAASDTQKEFGIVISNSAVKYAGMEAIGTKRQFYLGRPWKSPAKTAYVNNKFESGLIQDAGWSIWSGTENHLSAVYAEYGSNLLDGNPANTDARVDWAIKLNAQEAARYNQDNAFNYGEGNVWNALGYSTAPAAITGFTTSEGTLLWDEAEQAVGYLVFKNGSYLTSITPANYTDAAYTTGDTYEIAAYNTYGATTTTSVSGTGIKNPTVKSGFLKSTFVTNVLSLINADDFSSVEIINTNGQKIFTGSSSSEITVSNLQAGMYLVVGKSVNGETYVDRIIKK